ncbi:MAG: hypothetical protein HZB16_14950 [Armatimonadetes bacterium]|nr:hypothetical protein [Armatimonadota bacterium]
MNLHETAPRLLRLFIAGFALVLVQVGYWTLYRGAEMANHQRNPRYWTRVRSVERGRILDSHGQTLAESVLDTEPAKKADDDLPSALRRHLFRRRYPQGDLLSHVVGYSDWRQGQSGVESALSSYLTPPQALAMPRSFWELLSPPPRRGDDVVLTLDASLQKTAALALGNRAGAVVAVDVQTGAVLCMADYPRFDPSSVSDGKAWAKLIGNKEDYPLLPRAYAGLYPPGSTFKVLTAAAALQAGTATPQSTYQCDGTDKLGHSTVKCDKRSGHGQITLERGIAQSCNIALARVALDLGASAWEQTVLATGITQRPALFRPGTGTALVPPGKVPTGAALDGPQLAACGYGQGALAVTPLYLAGMGQMLGNGGLRHEPYLVDRITGSDGSVLYKGAPDAGNLVVSASAARATLAMMAKVFESGGTAAGLSRGMDLAGKTGSAQNPHGQAHSWFLAVGPARNPRVAVAVVVENAGWGRVAAGPVAVQVMRAALGR